MNTPTLQNLYAEILKNPADDTVRLAYADAAEEEGSPKNVAHAEFIRLQFELHRIGPKPYELGGVLGMHGPNYYDLEVSAEVPVEVGDRVNVNVADDAYRSVRSFKKTCPQRHNLLVTKVLGTDGGEDYGTRRLALRRDDQSVPYPADRVSELGEKCRLLWESTYPMAGSDHAVYPGQYRRGFVEAIDSDWGLALPSSAWVKWLNKIRKSYPIREIFVDIVGLLPDTERLSLEGRLAGTGIRYTCINTFNNQSWMDSFAPKAVWEYENFAEGLHRRRIENSRI